MKSQLYKCLTSSPQIYLLAWATGSVGLGSFQGKTTLSWLTLAACSLGSHSVWWWRCCLLPRCGHGLSLQWTIMRILIPTKQYNSYLDPAMNPRMRAFSGLVTLFSVLNISWASSICSCSWGRGSSSAEWSSGRRKGLVTVCERAEAGRGCVGSWTSLVTWLLTVRIWCWLWSSLIHRK